MAIKRIWSLEIWLLIFMAVILMLSITGHTEHAPHWSLWVAAGFLAFFMLARPKITGILIAAFPVVLIFLAHGLDLSVYSPVVFAGELGGELVAWIFNSGQAGVRLIWTFSFLAVFLIVYFQLLLISRGKNIAPLIFLGLVVFTILWYRRFSDVETGMFMFFAMGFPTASLVYIRKQSKLNRAWYKAAILGLSVLSALIVSIAPWDVDRLTVPEWLKLMTDPRAEEVPVKGEDGQAPGLPVTGKITGYSPGGELGGSVIDSHETVMRLELIEGVFPSSLYLRGRTSDYYTGYSWEKQEAEPAEGLDDAFNYVQIYDTELEIRFDYLEPEEDLFSLFPPSDIEIFGSNEYGRENLEYEADSFGNLQVPDPEFSGGYVMAGNVITRLDLNRIEQDAKLKKDLDELSPFLQVPDHLPERVKELASEITEDNGGDRQKADQIENFLRQFPYSREVPVLPPGEDFVDHFIFELGKGYCTYYASAMVVLLRLNDIPARYVEGYRVDHHFEAHYPHMHPDSPDMRQSVRSINVRKSNAHAWVEVFLQGYGWVAYEPTARYAVPLMLTDGAEEVVEDKEVEPVLTGADERRTGFGPGIYFAGIAVIGGLPVLAAFFRLYFKLHRPGTLRDIYGRVVKVKAAFSSTPLPGETPGKIASRLKEELPDMAGDIDLLISLYHNVRYSGKYHEERIKVEAGSNLIGLPLRLVFAYRNNMGLLQYLQGLVKLFF